MKNLIKATAAPLVLAMFTLTACDSDFAGRDLDSIKVDAPDNQIKIAQEDPNITDCGYDKRKTVRIIKNMKAHIDVLDREGGVYIISVPEEGLRFHACNLPADFLREGVMVEFTGEEKEVFANEKWYASPFKLLEISSEDAEFRINGAEM